jgi:DNA replication protein DnaC
MSRIWDDEKYNKWNADNKEQIRKHINNRHSIYLWSKYGLGKTHFLLWLSKKYCYQGYNVFYAMFSDISRELKKEIGLRQAGIFNKSIDTKMRECDMLCIDDLGNEQMTAFTHEALVGVINYRYQYKLPTFVTSNYNPKELYNIYKNEIGEVKAGQLITRIQTFGVLELKAEDYRKKYEY